jgi:hypothetical protein
MTWPQEFILKVLGRYWAVRTVDHALESDNSVCYGYTDSQANEIWLSTQGHLPSVLLHELQHTYEELVGIDTTTPEMELKLDRNAEIILGFLVDNLPFMRLLLKYLETQTKQESTTMKKVYRKPKIRKLAKR